jgi:23S rRNA (cytidine1920-2'-O)/16S rRNA (cytidine1409-2'-O)-methyltransferase
LDQELVERGLFESREKAQRAILAGQVWVKGQRSDKAGWACPPEADIEVRGADKYVGRGGYKLEGALDHFKVDPTGWKALDVGASTGGFTDCLLQRGAIKVVALDVGHGQLDWKIRQDPRVEVREKVNARFLQPQDFSEIFDLVVIDVAFISLRQILPACWPLLRPQGQTIALIKPQFEAGREAIGKGGIVRDPATHERVVRELLSWAEGEPVVTLGTMSSPLLGTDGNQEFLWHLQRTAA